MRRGVQECIRNWVGRPIQEHRPNFQFVCKIFHIRIIKNGGIVYHQYFETVQKLGLALQDFR